jgi:hypothetical protein
MGYQLELIDVSKLFGDVRAVDNVSLRIQHGEFVLRFLPEARFCWKMMISPLLRRIIAVSAWSFKTMRFSPT